MEIYKQYYFEDTIKDFVGSIVAILRSLVISLAAGGFAVWRSSGTLRMIDTMVNAIIGVVIGAIAWFGILLIVSIFRAPAKLNQERLRQFAARDEEINNIKAEKQALEDAAKPRLEIFIEKGYPFRQTDYASLVIDGKNIVIGKSNLHRIAIRNLSTTETVKDMGIELEKIVPDSGIPFLPAPLHVMHDNPGVGQPNKTKFDLNPGQTLYADLVSPIYDAQEPYAQYNDKLQIWHSVSNVMNLINSGNYQFTIHAHAYNCPDVRAVFQVGTDGNGIFFIRQEQI